MIFLSRSELLHVVEQAIGEPPAERDPGLLDAAAARPQASAFGVDAYPPLEDKAAALTHSLARNHALIDGNKRLALSGLIAFLGVNGRRLTMTNDEAYDLIIAVSTGALDDIGALADRIRTASEVRS